MENLLDNPYKFTVTTMQRTYNSVIDKDHFAKVRNNWEDHSQILDAWKWVSQDQKYVNVTSEAITENW